MTEHTKDAGDMLPCPVCGKLPEAPVDATGIIWGWRLTHQGCHLPSFTIEGDTRADVITKWNRRAPTPEAVALILAKEALEWYGAAAWKDRPIDPPTTEEIENFGSNIINMGISEALYDKGHRARATLDAINALTEGSKP